ncbi:MAG: hypothetical protein AAB658_02320 [Chloroflexota bacterium]
MTREDAGQALEADGAVAVEADSAWVWDSVLVAGRLAQGQPPFVWEAGSALVASRFYRAGAVEGRGRAELGVWAARVVVTAERRAGRPESS